MIFKGVISFFLLLLLKGVYSDDPKLGEDVELIMPSPLTLSPQNGDFELNQLFSLVFKLLANLSKYFDLMGFPLQQLPIRPAIDIPPPREWFPLPNNGPKESQKEDPAWLAEWHKLIQAASAPELLEGKLPVGK